MSADPTAIGGIIVAVAALATSVAGTLRNRRTDTHSEYDDLLDQFKALLDAERVLTDRQVKALEHEVDDLREHVRACEVARVECEAERRDLLARLGLG